MLIAERDILAGEVLFTDIPGAVRPDNDSQPICLACHKSLPGLVYDVDTVAGHSAAHSASKILVLMKGSVSCLEWTVQGEEVIK